MRRDLTSSLDVRCDVYKSLGASVSNARVSRQSPNWNPHSVRDADGAYTRNQRSGFDACSTSAKLLVQKARRAKARLSCSSTALYFRPEHSNETETARCEYYDVTYRGSHGDRRCVAEFADKVASGLTVEFRRKQLLAHKNPSI